MLEKHSLPFKCDMNHSFRLFQLVFSKRVHAMVYHKLFLFLTLKLLFVSICTVSSGKAGRTICHLLI